MITPAFGLTATERVLPRLALDFTTASLDPRITFTRTTGASNPATYIDSSGVITAATNNQPRFDYDPVTLVCKGLLIEESRTNSLLNTDLLSTQIVTVTDAVRTLSFYGTGSVTLSGAHTAVVSGAGAYPTRTTYSFTPTAGALTLTVAGTVQFAQLEAGAFATSYIPTTTTALTRNADVATMTGTNFSDWFNASEGSFVVSSSNATPVSTQTLWALYLDANNLIYTRRRFSTGPTFQFVQVAAGAAPVAIQTGTIDPYSNGAIVNTCTGYKLNDFALSINGVNTGVDTSSSAIGAYTSFQIGTLNGVAFFNGWVREINYYPQKLTLSEINAFSK